MNIPGLSKNSNLEDLKNRIIFLLVALIVYRIGSHIPVPGIDAHKLSKLFSHGSGGGFLAMINMFSGGSVRRFSVFALGVMPYISASIIIQLLSSSTPFLAELKKDGAIGKRKLTQYTRYLTVLIGIVQSSGIAFAMEGRGLVVVPGTLFVSMAVITLITGTMFMMWLGEQITENAIGNGVSLLIFAGIVSGLPNATHQIFNMIESGQMTPVLAIIVAIIVVAVTYIVVYVERAQRKIPVSYAKRQTATSSYTHQQNYLPLKINMSGVIPPIFASSILALPVTILSWLGFKYKFAWALDLVGYLAPGHAYYLLLYVIAIVFFSFFYTSIAFNPKETADNLRKGGAYITGIRPGANTVIYFERVVNRLTAIGSLYIALVCLVPQILIVRWNVPFYFGGTSLLIVVVVAMDFFVQLQTQLMSHYYEKLLKKANFKGRL